MHWTDEKMMRYRDPTDNAPFRQTFAPPLALKIGNQSYRFRVCQVHFWMLIWGSHVFVVYLKITGLFKAKVPKSAHFCTCSNFLNMHPLLSKHPSYTRQPRPAWFKGVSISVVQGRLKKRVQVHILRLSEVTGRHSRYQPKAQTIGKKIRPKWKKYMH